MEIAFKGSETNMHYHQDLCLDFEKVAEIRDLQNDLVRGLLRYLGHVWDHSEFHQRVFTVVLGIFQNIILETENPAWRILHEFIVDEALPTSGRNNAVWISLGLLGQLLGHPVLHQALVNDCIYMLFKTMTMGILLHKVSLNICYFENLDDNSPNKLPGIGLFIILGLNMKVFFPICCINLQRMMTERGGLMKTIKILIGLLDFLHCERFQGENIQECDECEDLVRRIIARDDRRNLRTRSFNNDWIRHVQISYFGAW